MDALAQLLPFILIAVAFWFLLIRPQRKRAMAMMQAQSAVAPGDEVLLGAGIVGRVASASDDFLHLEISPGVQMKVARGAVVRVLSDEVAAEPADEPAQVDLDKPADPDQER